MTRLFLTKHFWALICLIVLAPWAIPTPHASAAKLTPEAVSAYTQQAAADQLSHLKDTRIEVRVGALDTRIHQAPCAQLQLELPRHARLWNRASVIARCAQGAHWSLMIPVTVRVYGPALVATRPLPAMTPITANDIRIAEVELTREPQGVVTQPSQLINRVSSRVISIGQPIPLAALRAPQAVGQGDPVKIVGHGHGFSITTEAIAIHSAVDGQSVRVRTESGRVLTGTARTGRIVEVHL